MKTVYFFFALSLGSLALAQMNDTPAPAAPADQAVPPAPAAPTPAPAPPAIAAPATTPAPVAPQPTAPATPKHHATRAARALQDLVDQPKLVTPTVGYKEGDTSAPEYWIAHRCIDDFDGSGWGWVHKKGGGWGNATWVALKENPGVVAAPYRHLTKHDGDNNWEYKFWGHMADYRAYDAHLDERLPVFVLEGYEVIGETKPLSMKPGPRDRHMHARSTASSRPNQPIPGPDD